MNKAFKVLWNDVRRSYVVSSEAQMSHGKPARSSKTLVAAAVAGVLALGASSAFAALPTGPITNSNLPTIGDTGSETTKLVSGKGETINIQTNGSLGYLIGELGKVSSATSGTAKLEALLGALGPSADGKYVTIVGVTGGNNVTSEATKNQVSGLAGLVGLFKPHLKPIVDRVVDRTFNQFDVVGEGQHYIGDTAINIGDAKQNSNPLVLGVVGGDLTASFNSPVSTQRDGTSHINVSSGNVAGIVGGSVALNTFTLESVVKDHLSSTISATEIKVTGSANAGGIIAGGIAFGGVGKGASSTVVESTNLTIDTNPNFENGAIDGLVVGALGGGLAVATGTSTVDVSAGKQTNITANQGMIFGLVGGGAALSADKAWDKENGALGLAGIVLGGAGSGTSTSQSGVVRLDLNAKSTTVAAMGGGIAVADAYGKNVGSSTATVESVEMSLDGGKITDAQKSQLHSSAAGIVNALVKKDLKEAIKLAPNLDVDGVHIANLGGGAAIAQSSIELQDPKDEGKVEAISKVGSTKIYLNGGYNVATAAGGLAISFDHTGKSVEGQNVASSSVENTLVHVTGGENILVSGGGLSFATANKGNLSKAEANVGAATLLVNGGSVDGLYGGGIAVDDTKSDTTNAFANTKTITIEVAGGEIHAANMDPLIEISQKGSAKEGPGKRTYINETAKLFKAHDVAILGAGIASGGGAQANTTDSTINLSGGTVDGNVFGGGAATLGGNANVTNSVIAVSGANVTGDIYAAGLAGSELNDKFDPDYKKSSANVENSVIELSDGKFVGNIYAGKGVTLGTGTEAKVRKSEVKILKNGVFEGGEDKVIDATGVIGDASLTMANEAIDLGKATVTGFNNVTAYHAKNFTFDFGEKKATTFEGVFDVNGFAANEGSTLTLVGDSVLATTGKTDKVAFKVDNGVLALGDKADAMTAHDQLASVNAIPGLYLAGEVNLTGATATIGKVAEGATGVVIGANGSLMADAAADTTVTGTITGTKDSGIYFTNVAEEGANVVFGEDTLQGFDLENGITVDNIRYDVINDKNTFTFEVITNQAQLYLSLIHI